MLGEYNEEIFDEEFQVLTDSELEELRAIGASGKASELDEWLVQRDVEPSNLRGHKISEGTIIDLMEVLHITVRPKPRD